MGFNNSKTSILGAALISLLWSIEINPPSWVQEGLIRRPFEDVYHFVSDMKNIPLWITCISNVTMNTEPREPHTEKGLFKLDTLLGSQMVDFSVKELTFRREILIISNRFFGLAMKIRLNEEQDKTRVILSVFNNNPSLMYQIIFVPGLKFLVFNRLPHAMILLQGRLSN